MKKYMAVLLAILFLAPVLIAQDGGGRRRRRFRYDKANEKVYRGVVESVSERQGRRGLYMRILFKSGGKTCRLSAGPKGWLAGKGITLAAGTRAVVVGSVHTGRRGSTLFARTIRVAGKLVELRNADGHPNWPRPRRGRRGGNDD